LGGKAPAEQRSRVLAGLRAFVRETAPRGGDQALVARAALLGAAVAAGATPPDHAAVVELLEGFETRYPEATELHPRALELRLLAQGPRGEHGRRDGLVRGTARPGDAAARRWPSRRGLPAPPRLARPSDEHGRGPAELAAERHGVGGVPLECNSKSMPLMRRRRETHVNGNPSVDFRRRVR